MTEAPFLNLHDRCPGFVQISLDRGGDQVAEVGQVLVAAREHLRRDQVPDRCHGMKTPSTTLNRSADDLGHGHPELSQGDTAAWRRSQGRRPNGDLYWAAG